MGQRDTSGKRMKWTRAEKKMVKEMREIGLQPSKPVLTLRSKAEWYGKQFIDPATKSQNLPPHLQLRRTPRLRSVIVIPDAAGAGPSSSPIPHNPEPAMQIHVRYIHDPCGPSLPLSDLPTNIIMGIREKLPPKEQAKFLTADRSVARRPEVKEVLFQLKKVQRSLFNLMGEWTYYIRWIQPKEIARTVTIRQDRLNLAYGHYVCFNRDTRTEKMSINAIARIWGVYGTELRELIDWQERGDDDSSDDDIMQK